MIWNCTELSSTSPFMKSLNFLVLRNRCRFHCSVLSPGVRQRHFSLPSRRKLPGQHGRHSHSLLKHNFLFHLHLYMTRLERWSVHVQQHQRLPKGELCQTSIVHACTRTIDHTPETTILHRAQGALSHAGYIWRQAWQQRQYIPDGCNTSEAILDSAVRRLQSMGVKACKGNWK